MIVGGDLVPASLGALSVVCCAAPEYEGLRTLGRPRCTAGGSGGGRGVSVPQLNFTPSQNLKSHQHFRKENTIKQL